MADRQLSCMSEVSCKNYFNTFLLFWKAWNLARNSVGCPPDTYGSFSEEGNICNLTNNIKIDQKRHSVNDRSNASSSYLVEDDNNFQHSNRNLTNLDDLDHIEDCSDVYNPENLDKFGFFRTSSDLSGKYVDVARLRIREKKWIHMLDNWAYFMDKKYDKVRTRCRKGIPASLRGRAWQFLCGAHFHMESEQNRHIFEQMSGQSGNSIWVEDIKKDLPRQFPNHEMFAKTGPYGRLGFQVSPLLRQTDMFTLLKAYTVLHPEEGYCQGQAPVAAVLLMHMPVKQAFYCFVQICHKYLPGYYSAGLEAVQIDGEILFLLLKEKSRLSYGHLKKHNVDPVLYMVEWFMCIFCRTLPWVTVVRVWDMFLCEGVKVLFKVAIVLFRFGLGYKSQLKQCKDLHSVVTRLKNLPSRIMDEEFLINKVIELNIDEGDLERIHYRALKKRKKLTN